MRVLIHGEPEQLTENQRRNTGIPIIDKVCQDLKSLAISRNLEHPF